MPKRSYEEARAAAIQFLIGAIILTVSIIALYYGVQAYTYQSNQDQALLRTTQTAQSDFQRLEMYIQGNTSNLQSQINVLDPSALQAQVNALEMSTVRMINSVVPVPSNGKITLEAGPGITITDNFNDSSILFESAGILSINGVEGPAIQLLGTGTIDIINDVNNSQITVDGSALNTAIINLQMTDSAIMMDITDLQNTDSSLQMQITAIESVGQMLNDTGMDLNMTITELLVKAMMNEARIDDLEQQIANISGSFVQPGMLVPWTGTAGNIPSGYLLADGTEYPQASYPELFAVIMNMYCPAMVCTAGMFAVPDMRGRIPVGMAPMGKFMGSVGSQVGTQADEETTLTLTQMPAHDHSGTTNSATHFHEFDLGLDAAVDPSGPAIPMQPCRQDFGLFSPLIYNGIGGSGCSNPDTEGVSGYFSSNPWDGIARIRTNIQSQQNAANTINTNDGAHQHAFDTSTEGLGQSFTNVQPSLVMHYMIKT